MRYAIVIEKAENNYAAYVPDLPGCVATGFTVEETEQQRRLCRDRSLTLFQHRANAHDDQINNCDDDGQLDQQHGQANQKS